MAFAGKTVIVTGSSSGIGAATAVEFVKASANVTITGRNEERLKGVRDELIKAGASESSILSICGDITCPDVQKKLIEETLNKFGKIDVLVNNAGAGTPDPAGAVGTNQSIETYRKCIDTNLTSVLELTKLAKPHLISSKGEVINISSIAGLNFGTSVYSYYAVAKAGLDQLTRAFAIELAPQGVRVNGINPGMVYTRFAANMGAPDDAVAKRYEYAAKSPLCVPIGRVGVAEDIAELILFLADRKKSGYIVGQSIVIDGGSSIVMGCSSMQTMRFDQ